MAQLVTRVADEVIADIDELIAAGVVASRSEAVRLGLETLVDRHRRARTGRQIAEAYRRRPQTDEETAGLDEATRLVVHESPEHTRRACLSRIRALIRRVPRHAPD